jgi:hypothetical protein
VNRVPGLVEKIHVGAAVAQGAGDSVQAGVNVIKPFFLYVTNIAAT